MTGQQLCVYPADMDIDGYVRSGDEIRRVLALAREGIARYGFGEDLHPEDLRMPWKSTPRGGEWMDNAWLRGVRDVLEWVAGEYPAGPLNGTPGAHPALDDLYREFTDRADMMDQGTGRHDIVPGWPPPQSGEGIDATIKWLARNDDDVPVCQHGMGAYGCECQYVVAAM